MAALSSRTVRPAAAPGARRRSLRRTYNPTAWLFVLPAATAYAAFVFGPFVQTIWLGCFKWDGANPVRPWVGVANYLQASRDPIFWRALSHNLVYLLLNLTLPVAIGLVLAALVASVRRGRTGYRFALFLPHVLSLAIVGIIWGQIYDPNIGLVNQALRGLGLEDLTRPWLGDPATVLVAVILGGVWHGFPFAFVIYLAGFQGIEPTLYDAARIDGANAIQSFFNVTLPGLRNVTNLLVSGAFIGSLTAYTLVWTMTKGGPFYASEVISTYIYKRAFENDEVGYAAALSVALALIALSCTAAFIWLRERRD